MISAVIIAKNEEENISHVIQSVVFCDEVIVIDNNSSDKTAAIATSNKARVYTHSGDDFSVLRNFGMEKAQGDWILFVDADEEVSEELKKEMMVSRFHGSTVSNQGEVSYSIKRRDFFWGQELKHGETKTARDKGFIRLMKKGSGIWEGRVHERFIAKGSIGKLDGYINHYPHQTISAFLKDINHYSTLRAQELHAMNVSTSWAKIICMPFGKFFYTYFLKLGFLDGSAGFVYSFMMSFHSFLVQSKLYLL